jgi:hypothetical protein
MPQAKPRSADVGLMARRKPERGGPLTPGQAHKAHRAIRKVLLLAVAHAWLIFGVVALVTPHLLMIALVVVALYTASVPIVLRSIDRDIDRRTLGATDAARDSFGRQR